MPPKVKITKETIVETALDLVRKKGEEALNARKIAQALQCSTQPIFSNFCTMEDLRLAVIVAAEQWYESYMEQEMAWGEYPAYKASGMAYIRFAKEETELFKLLYMRKRVSERDTLSVELADSMRRILQKNMKLSKEEADLFHLEMWVFVHGIATMIVTGYLELDKQLISQMLTDFYQGLKKCYERKGDMS